MTSSPLVRTTECLRKHRFTFANDAVSFRKQRRSLRKHRLSFKEDERLFRKHVASLASDPVALREQRGSWPGQREFKCQSPRPGGHCLEAVKTTSAGIACSRTSLEDKCAPPCGSEYSAPTYSRV